MFRTSTSDATPVANRAHSVAGTSNWSWIASFWLSTKEGVTLTGVPNREVSALAPGEIMLAGTSPAVMSDCAVTFQYPQFVVSPPPHDGRLEYVVSELCSKVCTSLTAESAFESRWASTYLEVA